MGLRQRLPPCQRGVFQPRRCRCLGRRHVLRLVRVGGEVVKFGVRAVGVHEEFPCAVAHGDVRRLGVRLGWIREGAEAFRVRFRGWRGLAAVFPEERLRARLRAALEHGGRILPIKLHAYGRRHSGQRAKSREQIHRADDGHGVHLTAGNDARPARDQRRADAAFVEAPLHAAQAAGARAVERRLGSVVAREEDERVLLRAEFA